MALLRENSPSTGFTGNRRARGRECGFVRQCDASRKPPGIVVNRQPDVRGESEKYPVHALRAGFSTGIVTETGTDFEVFSLAHFHLWR
jgi:hypothetical protein